MNGKVLDKVIGGYTSWIIKGIDWAIVNEADIISMSLGGFPGNLSPLYDQIISTAWKNDVIVISSAGNSGPRPSSISSPGLESRTLTVGASNIYNELAFFSSRGPSINGLIDPDIIAPGRGILSLQNRGRYTTASGTSMAAPAVAGVIALLLSGNPSASPSDVRNAIISTASDMGYHVFNQGAGLINATAAYERLQTLSVFAFPSFTVSSPLVLSPGEKFEYQLDTYLNNSYNSLNITPSPQLEPYVNITQVDFEQEGWIRNKIRMIMPNLSVSGEILVYNGSNLLYTTKLTLEPDHTYNDAGSGTDAGDTFIGSLPMSLSVPIKGEVHKWDRDIYSFPVDKDQVYSVTLNNLTGNIDLLVTDENGSILGRSSEAGLLPEELIFQAQTSGNYFVRLEDVNPGNYSLLIENEDEEKLITIHPGHLTGKIASNTLDLNSDGLFDELVFSVEVNISEAGKFNFWYSISQNRSDYHFGLYTFEWDYLTLSLDVGVQNLNITIPGGLLESSDYSGSYVINDLAFGRNEFSTLIYYDTEVFFSPNYNHTQFNKLNNHLESFSISEKDIDKNFIPEIINIQLNFLFSSTGVFMIGIPIYNEHQNELLAYQTEKLVVSTPGLVVAEVEFAVQKFENVGDITFFGVFSTWFRYRIPIYQRITKESLATYEPIVTYSISDNTYDLDGNGFKDSLRISFTLDSKIISDVSLFTGHPFSFLNESMTLINPFVQNFPLIQGINKFWIDF
ncbi:MAG: S8 family serine peptidase, partial [Candidatus Hodarchaeales archaeon]